MQDIGHAGASAQASACIVAAMCGACCCAGFGVQALSTGEGALGSLAKFANSFAPELVEDVEKAVGAI